jgi:hypothetical protein
MLAPSNVADVQPPMLGIEMPATLIARADGTIE